MCNNLKCKFCNSDKVNKRGKQQYNNKQRFICRDCKKIWTDGADERIRHSESFKIEVVSWYLENVGIRSISRRMNISVSLIVRWIKEFGKIIKEKLYRVADAIDEKDFKKENIEILEIDELVTYVKKNSKILKQGKETLPSYGLLLIGSEIKLLDLGLEIEQKEPIKNSLMK